MSNSFIWNDATGTREPIEDRAAFLAELHRKNAEKEAAAAAVTEAPNAVEPAASGPAPLDPAIPLPGPLEDMALTAVIGPVDMPAKTLKPQAEKAAK